MKKIKENFKELSTHFLYICIGLFFLTPTIIIIIENAKLSDGVLSLIGSIIGGYLTLVGVRWGFAHERKTKFMDSYYKTVVELKDAYADLMVPKVIAEHYKSRVEETGQKDESYLNNLLTSDQDGITKAVVNALTNFEGELLLEFKDAQYMLLSFYALSDIEPDDLFGEQDLIKSHQRIMSKLGKKINANKDTDYPMLDNYIALLELLLFLIEEQKSELEKKHKEFLKLDL
ncbi:hypothetical protein [Priestia megaterium]|uniref:hypothetical protein n=1 Tax=Priestia megaterium TaxID=1404 RepID=UPI00300AB053